MTIYEFFTLMGGVGLFLYGMSIMSTGLKNAAGDKMKTILEYATSNRVISVLVGVLVTLLIQSSSATDMMVISFVNSGLMSLIQAIGVIMGANIGTTITAQITAFNLGAYAPMILFIGAIMYLFIKKNTVKHIGSIIMGFGMLFFGIATIKSAIVPLSQSEGFINFLSTLENPAVGVIFGVLFTALLQSSSSSVVIFQTFAVQGLLNYNMTVYLVIGAAIGSVTPNILASLTTNRNGKRTAVLNLLFNLIRAAIMIILINVFPLLQIIQGLTPNSIAHQVANTHTIFAILAVLIEFPFAKRIVALSEKIIPLKADETKKMEERKLQYLVQHGHFPSSVALYQARMEISRMAKITEESLNTAIKAFFTMDEKLVESVDETEDTVDYLTDAIQEKLIAMKAKSYPKKVIFQISQMMMLTSDIERISDYAQDIAGHVLQYKSRKAKISEIGQKELREMADAVLLSVNCSLEVFRKDDFGMVEEAKALEDNVIHIQDKIINAHIERLMNAACDPVGGVIYTDMVNELERCSGHAIKLARMVNDEQGM